MQQAVTLLLKQVMQKRHFLAGVVEILGRCVYVK